MANAYRPFAATTEQDFVTKLRVFLEQVVGWYPNYIAAETGTDHNVTWVSEGDAVDSSRVYIGVRGYGDELVLTVYQDQDGGTGTPAGLTLGGGGGNTELRAVSAPGRCRVWADKTRCVFMSETSATNRASVYLGFLDSFYTVDDDPFPALIRGATSFATDWTDTSLLYGLRAVDDTQVVHSMFYAPNTVAAGAPNPRSGTLSFYKPIVYYDGDASSYEVRGRLRGVLYTPPNRVAHGAVIDVDGDKYLATKTTDESDCMLFGPLTDDGSVPVTVMQGGFPNYPDYSVDYTTRGFTLEAGSTGTLALWRFDTDSTTYRRTSGAAYPSPASFPDSASYYNLVPQAGLTVVRSRLQEAADFNGSTQFATVSGSTAVPTALQGEWTLEMVFKPDTIPGTGADTILEYGIAGSAAEANNIQVSVQILPIVGTSPDEFDRGNLRVRWEKDAGTIVSASTTGDFIYAQRWNYVALVKTVSGPTASVAVWHCSFGDHRTPVLRVSLTSLDNATGGTNGFWFVGANADGDSFFDGQLDDTRITKRALSAAEILASCQRVVL